MKSTFKQASRLLVGLLVVLPLTAAAVQVTDLGVQPDGASDCTDAVQKALNAGQTHLRFPPGTYRLGTLELPADTRLQFAPGASVRINPERLPSVPMQSVARGFERRALFVPTGDRVRIEGLQLDLGEKRLVHTVIYLGDRRDFLLSGARVEAPAPRRKFSVLTGWKSSDIVVRDCRFTNLGRVIFNQHCAEVRVHGNRAVDCGQIIWFGRGSRYLRHYDNWSRGVTFQCVFVGGPPDPSQKWDKKRHPVPLGSSTTVKRHLAPEDEEYSIQTAGTYDIQIKNNYAEYGRTLAWGNRGRQVIFEGNVSRFMNDYSYGVEGCENVVFANNISINANTAGIMTMYWASKVVIRGNILIIRDEPYVQKYSDYDSQKGYWGWDRAEEGAFIRMHHGPIVEKDIAAGGDYGAGKVLITGNLCVNELSDRPRQIRVEMGRDVMLSGNKVVNGQFFAYGKGHFNVTGNEFISNLPKPHQAVLAGGDAGRVSVTNNVFRRSAPGTSRSVPALLMPELQPGGLRVVEDNTIEGWAESILIRAGINPNEDLVDFDSYEVDQDTKLVRPEADQPPSRVIIRNNEQDGTICIESFEGTCRNHVTGNLDLESLEPVEPKVVPLK